MRYTWTNYNNLIDFLYLLNKLRWELNCSAVSSRMGEEATRADQGWTILLHAMQHEIDRAEPKVLKHVALNVRRAY